MAHVLMACVICRQHVLHGVCSRLQVVNVVVFFVIHVSQQFYYVFFSQGGDSALHVASAAGQTAVVTLLLDYGADIHAENITVS